MQSFVWKHLDLLSESSEYMVLMYCLKLSAKKSDLDTQLNLALAWNRCDVAKEKILTVENRQEWQVGHKNFVLACTRL